jgi:hypothetical protein
MFLSPINGLTKFNIVLVVYKHFVPTALQNSSTNLLRHAETCSPYGNTYTVMTCRKTSERDSSPG